MNAILLGLCLFSLVGMGITVWNLWQARQIMKATQQQLQRLYSSCR